MDRCGISSAYRFPQEGRLWTFTVHKTKIGEDVDKFKINFEIEYRFHSIIPHTDGENTLHQQQLKKYVVGRFPATYLHVVKKKKKHLITLATSNVSTENSKIFWADSICDPEETFSFQTTGPP